MSARFPEDDEDRGMFPCWLPDEPPPEDLAPPLDECDPDEDEEWW